MTTHNEVKEAALHNKTLYAYIKRYEIGQCTWEEAMMAAAVSLATQYNNLIAESTKAVRKRKDNTGDLK